MKDEPNTQRDELNKEWSAIAGQLAKALEKAVFAETPRSEWCALGRDALSGYRAYLEILKR